MGRYEKKIEEGSFEHKFYRKLGFPPSSEEGGMPLILRITLGDMDLLSGFYMLLPADAECLSIEDTIQKYVLCEDRIRVERKFARDPNPDLLEIYDSILYLYEEAREGKVKITYHINNGASSINPADPVKLHQQTCKAEGEASDCYKLLDIVLEVYDNLDPFSGMTEEQKDAMLNGFRGIFILYLMDKTQDTRLKTQDTGGTEVWPSVMSLESCVLSLTSADHLYSILEYLASEDAVFLNAEGEYNITPRGRELLDSIIYEAEFYIGNYDIFGDVYLKGFSDIRFNTGYGENFLVPIFLREGIDPYRAIFIAALYLGNLDWLVSDMDILFSEELFKELFDLVPSSPSEEEIGRELLDRIIHEGKLKVEEQLLREARLRYIKSIEQNL